MVKFASELLQNHFLIYLYSMAVNESVTYHAFVWKFSGPKNSHSETIFCYGNKFCETTLNDKIKEQVNDIGQ